MPERLAPIANVRLARSLPRLLGFPGVLLVGGLAIAAYGALVAPMPAGAALIAAGAVLVLAAVGWAIWLMSIRLDVEEAAVRVHWLGGERRYVLTPGPVTRVRFRGENASSLRARTALRGWQLGPATLRDEEEIEIVRLAPTATAILVPTETGRLAIAPASEGELIDALTRAAHARRRQEEVAPAAEALPPPAPAAAELPQPVEPEPRYLTGIERAVYEGRLAEERAAAESLSALSPGAVAPAPAPADDGTASVEAPAVAVAPHRRWLRAPRIARPGTTAAFVLLPLVGAGAAWGIGAVTGRIPEPGSDLGRLTSLALVMAGPVTSIGAIMARAWWPRILGVVVAGGLVASVFIGRALLGPLN